MLFVNLALHRLIWDLGTTVLCAYPTLDSTIISKSRRWKEEVQKVSPNFQNRLWYMMSYQALNRKFSKWRINHGLVKWSQTSQMTPLSKWRILCSLNGHISPPLLCWLLNLEWISCFEHVVQSLWNTYLLGNLFSEAHLTIYHSNKMSNKESKRIRVGYLKLNIGPQNINMTTL